MIDVPLLQFSLPDKSFSLVLKQSTLILDTGINQETIPVDKIIVNFLDELGNNGLVIIKFIDEKNDHEFKEYVVDFGKRDLANSWIETIQVLALKKLSISENQESQVTATSSKVNAYFDYLDLDDRWNEKCHKIDKFVAVIKLQKWWRAAGAFKNRIEYLHRRKALIFLQSFIRRNLMLQRKKEYTGHIIKLQGLVRRHLSRNRLILFKISKKAEKLQPYRTSVVMELFATENTYVNQLNTLSRLFYNPLKAYYKSQPSTSQNPPVTTVTLEQIDIIFMNFEEILKNHRKFLSDLKYNVIDVWNDKTQLGPLFLKMADWLSIYVPYCNGFDESKSMLDKCMKSQPSFSTFVRTAEKVAECNKLDLSSFLILPIQRIPRYELLLKDLIKHTWSEHSDFALLKEALTRLKGNAKEMDRSRQYENSKRTIEALRSGLYGKNIGKTLNQATSRYLNEGPIEFELISASGTIPSNNGNTSSASINELNESSYTISQISRARTTRTRSGSSLSELKQTSSRINGYMYLFNDHLIISSSGKSKSVISSKKESRIPLYCINLYGSKVETDDGKHSFTLKSGGDEVFCFWAETAEKRQRWLSDLQEAIENCKQNFWKAKFEMNIEDGASSIRLGEAPVITVGHGSGDEEDDHDSPTKIGGAFQMIKRSLSGKRGNSKSSSDSIQLPGNTSSNNLSVRKS